MCEPAFLAQFGQRANEQQENEQPQRGLWKSAGGAQREAQVTPGTRHINAQHPGRGAGKAGKAKVDFEHRTSRTPAGMHPYYSAFRGFCSLPLANPGYFPASLRLASRKTKF